MTRMRTTPQPMVDNSAQWRLPLKWGDMSPNEQAETMRACILRFLESVQRAKIGDIVTALGATNSNTVQRQLRFLSATQQVYVDAYRRDPVYFRNGSLAHPTLQVNVPAGIHEYIIRTYNDRLTGRYVTITECAVSPLGEKSPKSGIRVDLADLDTLIRELARISQSAREQNLMPPDSSLETYR
jgi:hypothetical protein